MITVTQCQETCKWLMQFAHLQHTEIIHHCQMMVVRSVVVQGLCLPRGNYPTQRLGSLYVAISIIISLEGIHSEWFGDYSGLLDIAWVYQTLERHAMDMAFYSSTDLGIDEIKIIQLDAYARTDILQLPVIQTCIHQDSRQ